MKTKTLLFTAIVSIAFISSAQAQNVNIPDANFKAALVANASVNTNMDAEIQVSEASVFNGYINVSYLNIANLIGIEAFVALDSLDCSSNQIGVIDVSANIALTYLDCSRNIQIIQLLNDPIPTTTYFMDSLDLTDNVELTTLKCNNNGLLSLNTTGLTALTYLDCSENRRGFNENGGWLLIGFPFLDFTSNTALTTLICNDNGLESLNVWANTALTTLNCRYNSLTSLNVSANTALTTLAFSHTGLTSIDLSANIALTHLECYNTGLTSLDVSANTALADLECSFDFFTAISQCQLTSLNVTGCTALTNLDCFHNNLTSLDVSSCTALTVLNCSNNQLTSLNVKNGNNINMVTFNASGNPNLSCIEVDDVQWSNSNWPYIEATASFSENCSAVGILDNNESTAILAYPNPTTGNIYLSEPANITLTDLSGNLLLEEKNTNQLDISALPAGMYFLSFGENNQHTFKVIKE